MRTEMMQFAAGDGFEAGAGFSMADNNELLSVTLVLLLVLALVIVLIWGLSAWRKQEIELGEYLAMGIRGFIFVVIIAIFLGIS